MRHAYALALLICCLALQISWRLIDEPIAEDEDAEHLDPEVRKKTKCVIWLSYTSNMISCGVREIIRYLVEHRMVNLTTVYA